MEEVSHGPRDLNCRYSGLSDNFHFVVHRLVALSDQEVLKVVFLEEQAFCSMYRKLKYRMFVLRLRLRLERVRSNDIQINSEESNGIKSGKSLLE